ncbi:MAG: hypothetical protein H0W76_23760, partial [Pyrinomonadaceae bacterium]|nr:hypothetical protein [Pyrinomonadaceae bacterium]
MLNKENTAGVCYEQIPAADENLSNANSTGAFVPHDREQQPPGQYGGRASTIEQALAVIVEPGAVVEMRVPKAGRYKTVSGYYTDLAKLAADAAKWSGEADGVYISLNPVNQALFARAANRCVAYAERTTQDEHITSRRWLFIDCDAKRPAGISATDDEHAAALQRAEEVRAFLRELGFPEPVYADSGNGGHLLYRVDLPNTAEVTALLKQCLAALRFRFDDTAIEIDSSTYNASRMIKLYGTLAAKGDDIPERPHRYTRLMNVPERLEVTSLELLQHLAATV